ncbi:hypothetical protein [Xanthomonas euvesicatoria]|uniref:hypothetical protein n=1 Tax=Xanthomonas euvesicatoria TaxID=456327 RepID=UPI001E2F115D|nr:hypothetical protein [Xanthomonas euvesicatoria]MCC8799202.1 hypothetical protein [Xanthomonas euvesicatoria pv. euvesicatoria]MCC8807807.1 hypothetical protein [Xanthomonas euvesicatoria pv. euvesicatoria]MCC8816252.1 hypothetical protein [Xanthomonas euvesicatoria pv. euvesicatoria]
MSESLLANVQGIATLFIGGFVAIIAYMQWRTARAKVRLDLYERRLAMYQRMRAALADGSVMTGNFTLVEFMAKLPDQAEVRFLFGNAVAAFQDDMQRLALTLWHLNATYRDETQLPFPADYDPVKNSRDQSRAAFEYLEALNSFGDRFRPFLDVSKL